MAFYPPPPPPPPDQLPPPPLVEPPFPAAPPPWRPPAPTGWAAWSNGKRALVGSVVALVVLVALGLVRSLGGPPRDEPRSTLGADLPTASGSTKSPAAASPTSAASPSIVPTPTPNLQPAEFEQTGLTITPTWAAQGAPVAVEVVLVNLGGLPGSHLIELNVDGKAVSSEEVNLDGGARTTVSFAVPALGLGTHVIDVNGQTAEFKVADVQQPDSGTMLIDRGRKGRGHLTIENGTNSDAVVALTRANNLTRTPVAIYIRAGATETVKRIADGTYVIFYGFGGDWDAYSERFLTDANYGRFADELLFETTPSTLPGWRLTLQPVVGGNAPTDDIPEEDFPAFETDGE